MRPAVELNRKNITKILLIITFAILLFTVTQKFSAVLVALGVVLKVISPFLIGGGIAFIINVLMQLVENKLFAPLNRRPGKIWPKIRRPVSLLLSLFLIIGAVLVLMLLIIPEIQRSVMLIVQEMPQYMETFQANVTGWMNRLNISADTLKDLKIDWQSLSSGLMDFLKNGSTSVINTTVGITSGILSTLFNLVLGFAFAIYILADKEKLGRQIRKTCYALMKREKADGMFSILSLSNSIFQKFITGQFTEAVIIGVLCYIGMLILRLPYAAMISALVGFTALIPVFGAFIGTGVGALLILIISPIKALWFIIFIVVLQQVEGNLIYPKVVGKSVGLPGIWVLVAVTIGGGVYGAVGMLISVPLCSVLYCLFRRFIRDKSREKGLPADGPEEETGPAPRGKWKKP